MKNKEKTPAAWHSVKVVASPGTEFGVVGDKDGELVLVMRREGEDWPEGITNPTGVNKIIFGCKSYSVMQD